MLPDIDWSRGLVYNANIHRLNGEPLWSVQFLVKLPGGDRYMWSPKLCLFYCNNSNLIELKKEKGSVLAIPKVITISVVNIIKPKTLK